MIQDFITYIRRNETVYEIARAQANIHWLTSTACTTVVSLRELFTIRIERQ